jgi:serpin B
MTLQKTSAPAAALLATLLLVALPLGACDASGTQAVEPPRELTVQEQAVAETGPDFGLRLFRTVNAEEQGNNVFLSPLSVSMALGMTLNGAEGATRTAMEETLALNGLSRDEINEAYRGLIDLLSGLDPQVQMKLANSIWHRGDFAVEQPFIDANREYFDAEVTGLDFADPQASETINGWVDEKTEGKIEKIVPDAIPAGTVMYLINAIYFQGDWRYQFHEEETEAAPFTLADGSEKTVELMKQTEPAFAHYGDETLEAVDLPYGDSLYAMTVLVPRGETSVESLAAGLDSERWQAVTSGLREGGKAGVVLPRFTLEYEKTLNDALKAMGMEEAFAPALSDFSGINREAGERLYISKVKHKSFVKVNEEGTEAAAVTSVSIGRTSERPPVVRADRPFLFVIRENHSSTILFVGKVADPTA